MAQIHKASSHKEAETKIQMSLAIQSRVFLEHTSANIEVTDLKRYTFRERFRGHQVVNIGMSDLLVP